MYGERDGREVPSDQPQSFNITHEAVIAHKLLPVLLETNFDREMPPTHYFMFLVLCEGRSGQVLLPGEESEGGCDIEFVQYCGVAAELRDVAGYHPQNVVEDDFLLGTDAQSDVAYRFTELRPFLRTSISKCGVSDRVRLNDYRM